MKFVNVSVSSLMISQDPRLSEHGIAPREGAEVLLILVLLVRGQMIG